MKVHAGGFALLGPGLDGWERSLPVLTGEPYRPAPCTPPAPLSLPPNERRRTSPAIRLALAAAEAATRSAGLDGSELGSLFASANGDGAVVGAILESLATPQRAVSPTAFHNSVHNAPAAYWAIGAGSLQASASYGCHDDSVAAALLLAAARVLQDRRPLLLCLYDLPFPQPLAAVRATAEPFATAMVLTAEAAPFSRARLDVTFLNRPAETSEPRLPALRPLFQANPAARSLRLLESLARGEPDQLRLPYLDTAQVAIELTPC